MAGALGWDEERTGARGGPLHGAGGGRAGVAADARRPHRRRRPAGRARRARGRVTGLRLPPRGAPARTARPAFRRPGRSHRNLLRTMWQLSNGVRFYPWGSRTVIPELLGKPVPADRPHAELWIGAHPDEPSMLPDGRAAGPRHRRRARGPARARRCVERFGARLPFLMKVLAADTPAVAAGAPDHRAGRGRVRRRGGGRVPHDDPTRTFKDPFHKPELLLALDHVRGALRLPAGRGVAALPGQAPGARAQADHRRAGARRAAGGDPAAARALAGAPDRAGRAPSPRPPPGSSPPTTRSSSTPTAGRRRWPRPTRATPASSSR